MISFLNLSYGFLIATVYCIVLSVIISCLSYCLTQKKTSIIQWKDYWLMLLLISVSPILLWMIPHSELQLSLFDLKPLELITLNSLEPDVSININKAQNPSNNWFSILAISWMFIYLIGLLLSLFKLVNGYLIVRNIIKHGENISCLSSYGYHHYFKKLNRLHKLTGINIVITGENISPFASGLTKKTLVLPKSIFNELSEKQIKLVLQHEITHLRKNDPMLIFIGQLMVSLTWFNPIIKSIYQQLSWSIESSCDRDVLKNKANLRRIYAQAMLQILRISGSKKSKFLITAFSMKTHRSLTMRINNIMNPSGQEFKSKSQKFRLWSTAIAFTCLSAFAQPQLNVLESNDEFKKPMDHIQISSNYGHRPKFNKFHRGIDLKAETGTPIFSVKKGIIIESTDFLKDKKNYGTIVIIDHGDGLHSLYSHLNARSVEKGDKVNAGQEIGLVGETGLATGPHLHLEIIKNNQHQNPKDFINFN